MIDRTPPRNVPTLTEVVSSPPFMGTGALAVPGPQNEWVERVLERLEPILDQRLRAAIEQVVLEHTEALAPRLREEIEAAVRESVAQVLARDRNA